VIFYSILSKSHCSLDDSTLDCWQKTENYYLNELIETVNNLTKVEVMIDRWRIQNNEASRINDTVADILNRITTLKMNRGPMNDTYINDIMNYTTTEILNWAALKIQASSEVHYSLECPVPEDYVNTLWIYMFACACIVLALTLIYVVIHVHKFCKLYLKVASR